MSWIPPLFLGIVFQLAMSVPAMGQEKISRIGVLHAAPLSGVRDRMRVFDSALANLGYAVGRNLVVETRSAEGNLNRLPALAREVASLKPDVILVSTTPGTLAMKAATKTIPIVFVGVADPVGVGIVSNLARPEANVTGISNMSADLTGRRLALLKELLPSASRIAVLINRADPNASLQMNAAVEAARSLHIQLEPVLEIRGEGDLDHAFEMASAARAQGVIRMVDPTVIPLAPTTARVAAQYKIPVMYPFAEYVDAGGLAAYGTDNGEQMRLAAGLVDRVLRGARPADLAVEQPTKFELVINVGTAKALGLAIPASVRIQADRLVQ